MPQPTPVPPDVLATRERRVRSGGVRGAVAPVTAAGYVLLTWDAANRPAMLGVAAGMLAVTAVSWVCAAWVARSRARVPIQLLGALVNITGSTAFGVLDGGVLSPAGSSCSA
jgi:hypothetical protein